MSSAEEVAAELAKGKNAIQNAGTHAGDAAKALGVAATKYERAANLLNQARTAFQEGNVELAKARDGLGAVSCAGVTAQLEAALQSSQYAAEVRQSAGLFEASYTGLSGGLGQIDNVRLLAGEAHFADAINTSESRKTATENGAARAKELSNGAPPIIDTINQATRAVMGNQ